MPSEHLISSAAATSSEHTVAWVFGQPVTDLPQDLFIPPDALKVVLSSFQGPLDLLLYLIRKQNIDVLDIPMVKITEQYLHYIAQMEAYQFDLAAEYLLMAAMLIEIKSRLLLPRPEEVEDEEADPRAELVRRLLAYEQMKLAAQGLDALPRAENGGQVNAAAVRADNAAGQGFIHTQTALTRGVIQINQQDACDRCSG